MLPYFEYNGYLLSAYIYFKGNSPIVHSWDIVQPGVNLSKDSQARAEIGLTDHDMDVINAIVASKIQFMQTGR
jgi:hypothetical protein